MKTVTHRWMVKEPNKPVKEENFKISFSDDDDRTKKELKLTQQLVKGYVEVVWIGGDVKALVNEEAVFDNKMEHNCGYLGTIVFFREEEDGFGSLTDEDIRKIKAWTVVHNSDRHAGYTGVQVLTGEAADSYRKRLHEHQKMLQTEWESF